MRYLQYFNSYKSKLKRMVSDNAEATGGKPLVESLSNTDHKFLAIMGSGFGRVLRRVTVNPFPNVVGNKIILKVLPHREHSRVMSRCKFVFRTSLQYYLHDRRAFACNI
jgi:hypothetical protein